MLFDHFLVPTVHTAVHCLVTVMEEQRTDWMMAVQEVISSSWGKLKTDLSQKVQPLLSLLLDTIHVNGWIYGFMSVVGMTLLRIG